MVGDEAMLTYTVPMPNDGVTTESASVLDFVKSGPLERSACIGCPYQSRQRWAETKRRWPYLFAEAVEIDSNMRGKLAFAKEPYLHQLRIPLAEAVALDEVELRADSHAGAFGNECQGYCGV